MLFFTIGAIYLVYLVYLLIRAYSELRAMPYFGKHLNFLFSSYSNSQWKAQFLFIAVTTNSLLYTDFYFQYCETEMATTSNSCKHTNSVPMVQPSMHWNWSVSNLIWLWVNALVAKYPLKTLHGKTEIWFAKSNGLQYSVWEGSENMGFDLRRCNFFGLLNLDILCSCLCYKFYSFMFIHKISIRVVCASDYHPRSHDLSRWWKKDPGYPVATLM